MLQLDLIVNHISYNHMARQPCMLKRMRSSVTYQLQVSEACCPIKYHSIYFGCFCCMHNASVAANVLYGYSTVRMPSGQLYTVRTWHPHFSRNNSPLQVLATNWTTISPTCHFQKAVLPLSAVEDASMKCGWFHIVKKIIFIDTSSKDNIIK